MGIEAKKKNPLVWTFMWWGEGLDTAKIRDAKKTFYEKMGIIRTETIWT